MNKYTTKKQTQSSVCIQEEAIRQANYLIMMLVLGHTNLWGMHLMSSKIISEGKAYRKFMRKNYVEDFEIGDMVKKLPRLWFMGIFRFDIAWIVFGGIIIWLDACFSFLRSGVMLSGKFGYGKIDAAYILLLIAWTSLYCIFKKYLANKSQIFKNLMSEINEILIIRMSKVDKNNKNTFNIQ